MSPVPATGFLCQVQEEVCYLGVGLDEIVVIACETQEALYFCHISRGFPGFYLFDLGFFHLDLPSSYPDSKVVNLGLFELAFVDVEVQVVSS